MAVLTVQNLKWNIKTSGTICDADADVNADGLEVTFATAAAGAGDADSFVNDGETFFVCKNSHATNVYDLVFATQKKNDFGMSRNLVLKMPANKTIYFGGFPVPEFNDANNRVNVTYVGTAIETDLTVAAVKLWPNGR